MKGFPHGCVLSSQGNTIVAGLQCPAYLVCVNCAEVPVKLPSIFPLALNFLAKQLGDGGPSMFYIEESCAEGSESADPRQ